MSLMQFSGLLVVWLLSTLFIATLTWFEFRRVRFNFNVFFSLLFLLTFFFGFPLTSVLVFRFDVGVAPPEILLQALLSAACFYGVYYVTYKTRLRKRVVDVPRKPLFTMNRVETHLTWVILMGIALVSVAIFFMHNGFLLFRLHSYSQIFSSEVSGVALKRFFYFFIPAMLVVYFLRQDSKAWLVFSGEHRRVWPVDLHDCRRHARQHHYCVCYLPVYRHYSGLDQPVDAGSGGRAGDCRYVLAGAQTLRIKCERR